MEKTLNNSTVKQAKEQVKDIEVVGNGNMFQLLCKASSKAEGWMKSTKAMEIEGIGCVVQVTTQQGNQIAEALTFVPDVKIIEDSNGGRKLVCLSYGVKPKPIKVPPPDPNNQMEIRKVF